MLAGLLMEVFFLFTTKQIDCKERNTEELMKHTKIDNHPFEY